MVRTFLLVWVALVLATIWTMTAFWIGDVVARRWAPMDWYVGVATATCLSLWLFPIVAGVVTAIVAVTP